jgi:hypothetical protein
VSLQVFLVLDTKHLLSVAVAAWLYGSGVCFRSLRGTAKVEYQPGFRFAK